MEEIVDIRDHIKLLNTKIDRIEQHLDIIIKKINVMPHIISMLEKLSKDSPINGTNNNLLLDSDSDITLKDLEFVTNEKKSISADDVLTDESDEEYAEALSINYPIYRKFNCTIYTSMEQNRYSKIGNFECTFVKRDVKNYILQAISTELTVHKIKYEILCGVDNSSYRLEKMKDFFLIKINRNALLSNDKNIRPIVLKFNDKEDANKIYSCLQKE
uniref:KilA-N domain-containing protein n=1 Tax=Parastrongyloides trichosuri TaxID=131310 RepID=A0A0N4ZZ02_PARTI